MPSNLLQAVIAAILLLLLGAGRTTGLDIFQPAFQPVVPVQLAQDPPIGPSSRVPIYFLANEGQLASPAKYYAAGAGYSFFLELEGVTYSFPKEREADGKSGALEAHALKVKFLAANPKAALKGQMKQDGTANYFLGADSRAWKTDIATYKHVTYENLYPGIDLTYKGDERIIKYEFLVSPGADFHNIGLRYSGADYLRRSPQGDLIIGTPWGELKDEKPYIYQVVDGKKVRRSGGFIVDGRTVGFTVAGYDKASPLYIDPGLAYSTFIGSGDMDRGSAIAVDGVGRAYIVGDTGSLDFPRTAGSYRSVGGGVFVARLNASGSGLEYLAVLGGSDYDNGYDIAVDAVGNAYITGNARSHDFPTTRGAYDTTFNGGAEAFIAKLSRSGSSLIYSTFLGGGTSNNREPGTGIALDAAGNAYVTGITGSSNFPTTPGAFDTSHNGGWDIFVTKLNADGSRLAYSTLLGDTAEERSSGIAVDRYGNAYVTGVATTPGFPVTAGAFDSSFNGGYEDAFVTKLSAAGSSLVYSTFLGGGRWDRGNDIAVDDSGHAYVTGDSDSIIFPTTAGAYDRKMNDGAVFVTKLSPAGSNLVYSTLLGDSFPRAAGIDIDPSGSVYVTGWVQSPDFPTTSDAFDRILDDDGAGSDAFVSKISPAGSQLLYSTFLGGGHDGRIAADDGTARAQFMLMPDIDSGADIVVGSAGNVFVTGSTRASNFPTTLGAYDRTFNEGGSDAFVTKLNIGGPLRPAVSLVAPLVSTKISKTPTFKVKWLGSDDSNKVEFTSYTVRYRPAYSGVWRDWKANTTATYGYFKGSPGRTYYFRVKGMTSDGKAYWSKVRRTIVPYDEEEMVYRRAGFRAFFNNIKTRFYQGTVRYSYTRGNEVVYKFEGNSVGLISTKYMNRSKARVYIDGKYVKTIDARSSRFQPRRLLFYKGWQKRGTHYLKLVNLATDGRERFDVDALAVGR